MTHRIAVSYIPIREEGEDPFEADKRINAAIEEFVTRYAATHVIAGPSVLSFATAPPALEMRAIDKVFRRELMKHEARDQVHASLAQKEEVEALQTGVMPASAASMPVTPPGRPGGFPPRLSR